MHVEQTDTRNKPTLRELAQAAPVRTVAAAGLIGLMWGPILAGVLQVASGQPLPDVANASSEGVVGVTPLSEQSGNHVYVKDVEVQFQ